MRSYKFWFIIAMSLSLLMSASILQWKFIPAPAQAQTEPTAAIPVRTITVGGDGSAKVKPDTAQATVGVEVINKSLDEATSAAQQQIEAILAALKAQGVADEDIQTANYSISVEQLTGPDGQLTGEVQYHVSNQVTVTVHDLDKVGQVLDAAIKAGANSVYGVNFTIADPTAAQSQAREDAVKKASAKAQELAQLNGVQLGDVLRVSEVPASSGP